MARIVLRISHNSYQINAPDFFLVGAAKSGTTTLYHLLSQHPRIFFPKKEKEPFYFCFGGVRPKELDPRIIERVTWNTNEYIDLYKNANPDQICCDASTSYLYHSEDVISNIQSFYGQEYHNLKIGIILRNPVARAYSHYTYLVRNGHESLDFEEALKSENIEKRKSIRWGFDYLEYGKYYKQVKGYIDSFEKTKLFLFEDLRNPQEVMNETFEFLELDSIHIEKSVKTNPSGIPKNKTVVHHLRKNKILKSVINLLPESIKHKILQKRDRAMERFLDKSPMNEETLHFLKGYYKEDILKLENLINRDLSHWMA